MGVQRGRGLEVGDQVYLEISGEEQQVNLNSILYNVAHPPVFVAREPIFYTTQERFTQLTGEAHNGLVLATIHNYTDERVETIADQIQHDLEN